MNIPGKKRTRYDEALHSIVKDRKILAIPCIEAINHGEIREVISDLRRVARVLDRNKKFKCLGLAANQIGHSERIFVLKDERSRFQPWVNPVLVSGSGSMQSRETCYSWLGSYVTVERFTSIVVSDMTKKPRRLSGKRAIAWQHEMDHMNGVLV